jgi:nitrous oxidase accessory protein NosD
MRAWKFGAGAIAAGVALGLTAPAVASAGGPPAPTYVQGSGKSSNSGKNCGSAKYATIAAGVAAAPAWSTVIVCPGSYNKGAHVTKPLRLIGYGATVNASGQENGIWVTSSHVTVAGFTLKNANGEGLLAGIDSLADIGNLPPANPVLTDILVTHVKALSNDRGFNGTEMGNCKYPGDCGGGIHLNVVSHSMVSFSTVVGNADGILLTDDYGPNFRNFVVDNLVTDNKTECGIVLASHASNAVTFDPKTFKVTKINPDKGGLYNNAILGNTSLRNGTALAPPQFGGGGSGSGIGIFGSGPGSAAYNNLVSGNYTAGNGLAGFTIHAHHPGGEDVNGNAVINNVFGRNNVGGDGYDGPPVTDFKTTAIAVFSVPPVSMVITGNKISNNAIGIWLSKTVNAQGLGANSYSNVTTKVVRG